MDLQQDAYKIKHILPNVEVQDIIKFLRTKVPLGSTQERCYLALQHFFMLDDSHLIQMENYEDDLNADLLSIQQVLNNVSDEDIRSMLKNLGSIPNRKYIATKLLVRTNMVSQKRKNEALFNDEIHPSGSNKHVKKDLSPVDDLMNRITFEHDIHDNRLFRAENVLDLSRSAKVEKYLNIHTKSNSPPMENDYVEDPDPIYDPKPSNSQSSIATRSSNTPVVDLNRFSNTPVVDLNRFSNTPVVDLNHNKTDEDVIEVTSPPDEKLILKLIEVFPDASPDYVRKVCAGKVCSSENVDEIVTVILSAGDYPKRPERPQSPTIEIDIEEQFTILKEMLPDADPSYLQEKLEQLSGDQDGLRQFVEDAMVKRNYPTLKEYLRKQQLSAQQRQYTNEFDVERFIELFPDPASVFEDPNRKCLLTTYSDSEYVIFAMRNKFPQLYVKDIRCAVDGRKNIYSTIKILEELVSRGICKRYKTTLRSISMPDSQNIPLLQELAYFEHKQEIYHYIENKKKLDAQERQNAKELGLLQSCSCCYDDEVMPKDILTCTGGCRFCRNCIKQGVEIAFGEGKINFSCLMSCGAEFCLQVLQDVLPPKTFSKVAQKKALAEVKAAGIEDLELCPFCDFATIPPPKDKIFRCLNQDCMKESCRSCKRPSHVPLRCEEVEEDESVKARTFIENKMSEALIRQCYKCNAQFIKEEGCNKMRCSCGALMCYVCRKPVTDYQHFNGQGGTRYDLCPLFTDNFSVNEKNVLKAAEEAKKSIDTNILKYDPSADLEKKFANKIKQAEKNAQPQILPAPPQNLPPPPQVVLRPPQLDFDGIYTRIRPRTQEYQRIRRVLRNLPGFDPNVLIFDPAHMPMLNPDLLLQFINSRPRR